MHILRNQLAAVAGVLELVGLEVEAEVEAVEAEKAEGSAVGKSGRQK